MEVGKAIIRFDEVPAWEDEPFENLDTTASCLASHKDIVWHVVAAVADAQKQIYDDPKGAAAILAKGSFAGTDVQQIESALINMHMAFRQVRMSDARWNATIASHRTVNAALANTQLKEAVDWTNEFYPK